MEKVTFKAKRMIASGSIQAKITQNMKYRIYIFYWVIEFGLKTSENQFQRNQ